MSESIAKDTLVRATVTPLGLDSVTVCIRHTYPVGWPSLGWYEVFVDGGLLGNGENEYMTNSLAEAHARARREIEIIMTQDTE